MDRVNSQKLTQSSGVKTRDNKYAFTVQAKGKSFSLQAMHSQAVKLLP